MNLSTTILLLTATFVTAQRPDIESTESFKKLPLTEKRKPKNSCKGVKEAKGSSTKTTKAPKGGRLLAKSTSTKQPKSSSEEECYCPCCDLETCMFYKYSEPFTQVLDDEVCEVGPYYYQCPETNDPCKYDEFTGELDEDGDFCFSLCCMEIYDQYYGCGGQEGGGRRDRRLNENSASNERVVQEHDAGVIVEVTAGNPDGLDWIKAHVEDMRERMEKGDAVRTWDPLFKAYFENTGDIDMACIHAGGDVMSCKYSGASECAVDLIKAHEGYHSKIADSIRTLGTHEIDDKHAVPASCQP